MSSWVLSKMKMKLKKKYRKVKVKCYSYRIWMRINHIHNEIWNGFNKVPYLEERGRHHYHSQWRRQHQHQTSNTIINYYIIAITTIAAITLPLYSRQSPSSASPPSDSITVNITDHRHQHRTITIHKGNIIHTK